MVFSNYGYGYALVIEIFTIYFPPQNSGDNFLSTLMEIRLFSNIL